MHTMHTSDSDIEERIRREEVEIELGFSGFIKYRVYTARGVSYFNAREGK